MTPSNQTPYADYKLRLALAIEALTGLAAQYTKDAACDGYEPRVQAYLENKAYDALQARECLINLVR